MHGVPGDHVYLLGAVAALQPGYGRQHRGDEAARRAAPRLPAHRQQLREHLPRRVLRHAPDKAIAASRSGLVSKAKSILGFSIDTIKGHIRVIAV